MAIKIIDLAKEMGINSTQLLEKIKELKTGAKNRDSEINDVQAEEVRKLLGKVAKKEDTKIVKKVATKVVEAEQEEPVVIVKAAKKISKTQVKNATEKTATAYVKHEEKEHVMKPPVGKALAKDKAKAAEKEIKEEEKKVLAKKPKINDETKKAEALNESKPEAKQQEMKEEKPVAKSKEETASIKEAHEKPIDKEENKEKTQQKPQPVEDGMPRIKILKKFDAEAERLEKEKRAAQKKEKINRDVAKPSDRREGKNFEKRDGKGNERSGFSRRDDNKDSRPSRGHERSGRQDGRTKENGKFRSNTGQDRGGFAKDKDDYGERRQFQSKDKNREKKNVSGDAPMVNKPQIKRDENKSKNKERNKFAKLEGGKPKPTKIRSLEKAVKPKKHQNKPKQVEEEKVEEALPLGTKQINVPITVAGFCEQLSISTSNVIMKLMKLGIMANINQSLDEASVLILADELGIDVVIGKIEEEVAEEGIENFEDRAEDLKPRPPIVTVMGHVDHGKTSLLDAIRKTNVIAKESGGITQHIGASEVTINGKKIVFLDTPGHEAFTAMRARGAHGADIAILVVAADDSVKPQTVESISHAKAAGVPIIVAINKIDKPAANIDRVKQDLAEHGVLVEDWGGDTISVPVSAKAGEGIVNLLEMVLLQAEVMELKANPDRLALGTVIEARLDKAKGPVASLLVTNGTLHAGMSVVAGTTYGRIKAMTNFKGDPIKKAGPSTAVEILGFTEVPQAGDVFNAVSQDKIAREVAENRKAKQREEVMATTSGSTLEELFSQIEEGEIKELNLIVKGDVQGSVGALVTSFEKLQTENVRAKIIHSAVGTVTESDVMLAQTSGAVIIGFNVRPSTNVSNMADRQGVEIRTYSIIYDAIDDVESAMKGMLDPEYKEELLGKVEVRTTFKVPNVGTIAGAYVLEGKVIRNALIRLVRDGIVHHEGKVSSLKRFKDDVKEVMHGYECGIGFENYNDLKEGDIIECFHMVEIPRK